MEESKIPKKKITAKFEILPNTLSTILKKKAKIIKNYETSDLNPSRTRHRKHDSVDSAIYKWLNEKRAQNILISERILLQKAEYFATKLEDSNFKANAGWLDRFKSRHGIVCRSVCGESCAIYTDIEHDW